MKNNYIQEIFVSVALVLLSTLLLNPFHFWMPDMMLMSMLAGALVLFGIFASFVLRERVVDERESLHRTLADRNAFLAGSAMLIVGVVVEGYHHSVDPWLIISLTLMLGVKIGTRVWIDYRG